MTADDPDASPSASPSALDDGTDATRPLPVRPRRAAPTAAASEPQTVTRVLAEPPGAEASPARPPSLTGPPAVVAALRAEELARMRGWALAVVLLCSSALAFSPVLPGTRERKLLFVTSVGLLLATAVWAWWRCRAEAHYTRTVFRAFGFVAATVSFELVHFLGVFSPVPVVITLGVTFVGLGLDRRGAMAIPLYAIAGYAALAGLVTAGVLEDHGVIRAPGLALAPKLFGVIMVPVVLLMTLGLARLARRTMDEAAHRSHAALRLANQREALLAEANEQLEGALQAGRGAWGRWSGACAGPWLLDEVIGRGAMGEVYAAHHQDDGSVAAVKLLREEAARDARLVERFLREGAIAASLDTPGVVRIFEAGRMDGRVPYLAMERLVGEDLARMLRRRRSLDRAGVIELATQVAAGLDAAHAAGVIHRDLKPQNLFLAATDDGPRWKVLDFGVSTLIGSTGTLTQAAVVGTPGYMAPEQARALAVDHRCDLFSLATVLYRVLTGRPAFTGADTPRILFEVVYRMPLRPGELVDALPADVDAVLAIGLAKGAADRFASGAELATALTAALRGELDPAIRQRGQLLVERHRWGSTREHEAPP